VACVGVGHAALTDAQAVVALLVLDNLPEELVGLDQLVLLLVLIASSAEGNPWAFRLQVLEEVREHRLLVLWVVKN